MSGDHHGRAGGDPCAPKDLSPQRPHNRPALDAIAYRIGRHADFVARMLDALPREELAPALPGDPPPRPLKRLTTRTTDDPTIALIDAWACALDVLTFYQERIANEGYIRSAVERESVLELARMIGHELDPGVAASAGLAFTVEDADNPFRVVEVPAGTQVLSIPKKSGERPQTFETVAGIAARAEWNAIPARTERPQNVALFWDSAASSKRNGKLYLLDLDNSFALDRETEVFTVDDASIGSYLPVTPGLDLAQALADLREDHELNPDIEPFIRAIQADHLHVRGLGLGLKPGDRVLAVGVRTPADDATPSVRAQPFRIEAVEDETDYGLTRLAIAPIDAVPAPVPAFTQRFTTGNYRPAVVMAQLQPFNTASAHSIVGRSTWRHADLSAFVRMQAWPREQLMVVIQRPSAAPAPTVGQANPGLFVFRQTTGFFGNGAPRWETLAKPDKTHAHSDTDPNFANWDASEGASPAEFPRRVWTDSQGRPLKQETGFDVLLEREVTEVVPDSWALFETSNGVTRAFRVALAGSQSRADFALSGKATGMMLREPDGGEVSPFTGNSLKEDFKPFFFRSTSARVASEALTLSGLPIAEEVAANDVMLAGLFLDLEPGRAVSVRGERADAKGIEEAETCILDDVVHIGGYTRLKFTADLGFSYRRASVRVNANVAPATHGETIAEPLGSGDATQANQAFKLAKPPLTFVSAPTETGTATTLSVRVNDIAWSEVPALYDAGPRDEVYQVRIDDDGTTRIIFGDGEHGKRMPSGSLNARAIYRSGMGSAGEVDEETLSLIKTLPLGVRAVTNPSPAKGAAAAESRDEARERAPQSVRTLGRIVSLTDYEDFAHGFAGIGKAKASIVWWRRQQHVHVTVAPAVEGVFIASDAAVVHLVSAMQQLRDPARPFIVAPHVQHYFRLTAKVFCQPRYLAASVGDSVRRALLERFGYPARKLGESVSTASVIATIQSVDGVDHVDLDALAPFTDADPIAPPPLIAVLPAGDAHVTDADPSEIAPAGLISVLEAGITLVVEAAHA